VTEENTRPHPNPEKFPNKVISHHSTFWLQKSKKKKNSSNYKYNKKKTNSTILFYFIIIIILFCDYSFLISDYHFVHQIWKNLSTQLEVNAFLAHNATALCVETVSHAINLAVQADQVAL
jgi:hypothetical protein